MEIATGDKGKNLKLPESHFMYVDQNENLAKC